MGAQLGTHGKDIVPKVQAVYAFEIREKKGGKPQSWTVDLKNGNGQLKEGKIDGVKADATFVMLDDDFMKLAGGKLQPQQAFMQVSCFLVLTITGQNENPRKHESCS